MAKRLNNLKIMSEHLQGKDSYITLKALTIEQWDHRNQLISESNRVIAASNMAVVNDAISSTERDAILEANEQQLKKNEQLLNEIHGQLITGWDWVDNDDKPLPLPSEDPKVWQMLTVREASFIVEEIAKSAVEEKKVEKPLPA